MVFPSRDYQPKEFAAIVAIRMGSNERRGIIPGPIERLVWWRGHSLDSNRGLGGQPPSALCRALAVVHYCYS